MNDYMLYDDEIEPPRNYLHEAYSIANGETMLLPEKAHLFVLLENERNLLDVIDKLRKVLLDAGLPAGEKCFAKTAWEDL